MTGVTIIHEAEVELWEAVAYYEERARGLGLDFEIEIELSDRLPEQGCTNGCLATDHIAVVGTGTT